MLLAGAVENNHLEVTIFLTAADIKKRTLSVEKVSLTLVIQVHRNRAPSAGPISKASHYTAASLLGTPAIDTESCLPSLTLPTLRTVAALPIWF